MTHPTHAIARTLAGAALAVAMAASAAAVSPEAAAHAQKARAELAQDRILEAMDELDAALALAPDEPAFHAMRGDALMRFGQDDQALPDLSAAIRLYGDDKAVVVPLMQRAALSGRSDPARACQDVERAIAIDPAAAGPHYALALLLWAGDRDRALAEIDRSVAFDPKLAYYREIRAMLRSDTREFAAAVTALDADVVHAPGDDMTWATRAEARLELGDAVAAHADARHALSLRPDNAGARLVEAFADVFLDDIPAAAAILREVQARSPDALARRPPVAGTGPGDLLARIAQDDKRAARAHLAWGMLGVAQGDRNGVLMHFTEAVAHDVALGKQVKQAQELLVKN